MTLTALVRRLSGRRQAAYTVADSRAAQREERIHRAVRCDGCNVWSPGLLHLGNGGAYCHGCARRVTSSSVGNLNLTGPAVDEGELLVGNHRPDRPRPLRGSAG
jgi:hypothetical protein